VLSTIYNIQIILLTIGYYTNCERITMELFNYNIPIVNCSQLYNYLANMTINQISLFNIFMFYVLCFSDFILLPGFIDFVAGDVVSLHLLSTVL